MVNEQKVRETVTSGWNDQVLPSLSGLIGIPALSPAYDASWQEHGHLRAAAEHFREWVTSRPLPGARCEIVELPGCTPLLMVDVPETADAGELGTVLLYGHLDKQPPLGDSSEGLGPWQPVLRDGRLYGRGSVDDGYAGYAAVTALEAVAAAGGEHGRAVLLLESGEESGSPDLPAYLDHLAEQLPDVSLVISLDAGGGDYKRMWLTSSLRGVFQATVTVRVLETALHSGLVSGIVPSSFRVMRQLLDRLEDAETGKIKVPEMRAAIPEERRADAEALAALEPGAITRRYPLAEGMARLRRRGRAHPQQHMATHAVGDRRGRAARSGCGGRGAADVDVPEPDFRLPPTVDAETARAALVRILTSDVPYGAQVKVGDFLIGNGWHAPIPAPWLAEALERAGDQVFGKPPRSIGLGGGIPFMEMLGKRYPQAQFVVTGAVDQIRTCMLPTSG